MTLTTEMKLPHGTKSKARLARFVTHQFNDDVWFQVVQLVPGQFTITKRCTGAHPGLDTLTLDIVEAHALLNLLATTLERKITQ